MCADQRHLFQRVRRQLYEVIQELRYVAGGHYPDFVVGSKPEWTREDLPVFTFHGVDPKLFELEMAYLARNGYRTLNLNEFLDFLSRRKRPSHPSVLLTFDDGLQSVWTLGGPILNRHGFKAVAFVVPHWVGKVGYLDWSEISEMYQSGIFNIQSHTLNHLPQICGLGHDPKEVRRELFESKRMIEENLPGHRVEHLCYPQGLGSQFAVQVSKTIGYISNFWSGRLDRSINKPGDDPYYIVRLKHDYIRRLPGQGRISFAAIIMTKALRRLKGMPFVY